MTGSRPDGIVLAAQRLSDCRSAFFSGVPGFENRVGVGIDPVDREGAAIHQNNGERLAGGGYRFDEIFFRLRKIDAGAVAAEKARFTHRHLFAFKLTGDADNGDHYIGILCRCDGFRRNRVVGPSPRLVPQAPCRRCCHR